MYCIELMQLFLLSTFLSFVLSKIRFNKGLDNITGEPQKIHTQPIPRVGGFAVFLSTIYGFFLYKISLNFFELSITLAFISGFIEDITRKLSEKLRLLLLFISALTVILGEKILVQNLNGVPILESLINFYPFAVIFTAVAIAGLSNAFNIIDGLNGLASGIALIILISIYFVAGQLPDLQTFIYAKILILSLLGFFIWNFPWGRIFLGDGGAYFLGFYIACLVILLNQKNVPAWYSLAVIIYPVFEVIFSMIRRGLLKKNPLKPDRYHLHTLLFTILSQKYSSKWANPMASAIILLLYLAYVWVITVFWNNSLILVVAIITFCAIYTATYFFLYKKWVKKLE